MVNGKGQLELKMSLANSVVTVHDLGEQTLIHISSYVSIAYSFLSFVGNLTLVLLKK